MTHEEALEYIKNYPVDTDTTNLWTVVRNHWSNPNKCCVLTWKNGIMINMNTEFNAKNNEIVKALQENTTLYEALWQSSTHKGFHTFFMNPPQKKKKK